MSKKRKPMASLAHLNGLDGAMLRLELMRQGVLLGAQSMQFLAALKRVAELGMRIKEIVRDINAMSDADMRRHIAEFAAARAIMDAALRLDGGQQRETAPSKEAVEVPGSERRQ